MIDLLFLYCALMYLFRKGYFPIIFSVFIFYPVRSFFLSITNWPEPPNYIFESPGFPSFFVNYMKSNDLYYSGHSGGLTLVLFFFIYEKKYKRALLSFFILCFTIIFLLITNAHYFNDIIIGFF